MNLEELRSVRRTERQKDSLQPLRESFYRDVAEYVGELKAERDRVASEADDPFSSPEVGRLTDEIESAEEVVESLYERRVGKVVKLATFAAADMSTDEEGLTHEEQDLFVDLVDRIKRNRQVVLDTLAGEHEGEEGTDPTPDLNPASGPGSEPESTADAEPASDPTPDASDVLADAMGEASDEGEEAPSPPDSGRDGEQTADGNEDGDVDRTTVRITRDVGAILGVDDREYDLACDDVVTLPAANADPLVEREAAERLE